MKNVTDESLVAKCLAGDDDAFAEIVTRYQNQVFSLAYRLCGNYDEAADLAQEAFIRIYKQLEKFDNEKKFFPWMYRVAHNYCVNILKKKNISGIDIDEYADIITDHKVTTNQPDAAVENTELKAHIDEAILGLPENYREPVILRYIYELSYNQIAEVMNVPVSTIETRLYRGRQLLQKELIKYVKIDI